MSEEQKIEYPPLPKLRCGPETGHFAKWVAEDLIAWRDACVAKALITPPSADLARVWGLLAEYGEAEAALALNVEHDARFAQQYKAVDDTEAALRAAITALARPADAQPLSWYRPRSDGGYESPYWISTGDSND